MTYFYLYDRAVGDRSTEGTVRNFFMSLCVLPLFFMNQVAGDGSLAVPFFFLLSRAPGPPA
jgi:hypothetical protein